MSTSQLSADTLASIQQGLKESAASKTVDLGDFTQYITAED